MLFKSMFSFFQKTKTAGYIALFNLQSWWNDTFSEAERKHIVEVYKPLGGGDGSLTTGDLLHADDDHELMFLATLAGWFNNPKDRAIAYKIIEKAEEFLPKAKDILDVHFFYPMKMKIYYADREKPESLERAIKSCFAQINIAEKAASAFKKEYKDSVLPLHEGYEQLCIIYEKQGKFEDVIKLAKKAKQQGWGSNWDSRIERCQKRLIKQAVISP